jgi:hypothetical protein
MQCGDVNNIHCVFLGFCAEYLKEKGIQKLGAVQNTRTRMEDFLSKL